MSDVLHVLSDVLHVLSVVPAPAPPALPSPGSWHHFPKVLSKSWQENAEHENRQEKPSWSFSGMQTTSWALLFFSIVEFYIHCIRLFEIPRCRTLCSQTICVATTIPIFLSLNTLLESFRPLLWWGLSNVHKPMCTLLHGVSRLTLFSEHLDHPSVQHPAVQPTFTEEFLSLVKPEYYRHLEIEQAEHLQCKAPCPKPSSRPGEKRQERKPVVHDRC